MKIKYYLERIISLSKKFYGLLSYNLGHKPNAFELIKYSSKMIHDNLHYHATFSDFFDLAFYKKTNSEKKKYITAKDSRGFAIFVDGEEKIAYYTSKTNMYKALPQFVKRDQLFLPESSFDEFSVFAAKHGKFLYKPDADEGGHGIGLVDTEGKNLTNLYEDFCTSRAVLDELIEQCDEMKKLCPSSVNTVRIFTLRIGDDIQTFFPLLRMGDGTKVVDNFYSGGLISALDLDTGVAIHEGVNGKNDEFEFHPQTNVRIKGFQIPRWNELKEFVVECAKVFDLDYVAWDIAIRENDFVMIEANPNGGTQAPQMAGATPKRAQFEMFRQQITEYRANIKIGISQ